MTISWRLVCEKHGSYCTAFDGKSSHPDVMENLAEERRDIRAFLEGHSGCGVTVMLDQDVPTDCRHFVNTDGPDEQMRAWRAVGDA